MPTGIVAKYLHCYPYVVNNQTIAGYLLPIANKRLIINQFSLPASGNELADYQYITKVNSGGSLFADWLQNSYIRK